MRHISCTTFPAICLRRWELNTSFRCLLLNWRYSTRSSSNLKLYAKLSLCDELDGLEFPSELLPIAPPWLPEEDEDGDEDELPAPPD